MSKMNDDDLGSLLKKLPRHQASPGFTDSVVARLEEPAATTGPMAVMRPGWALVGAAVVVVGLWLGATAWRDHTERRELERLRMMRDEYQALELELEELRSLASEAQPVLDLGGTERVDFVFDLRRHAEERDKARAQRTSHSPR